MTTTMRVLSESGPWRAALLCLALVVALAAIFASGRQIDPQKVALACIGIPAAVVVVYKYPPLLIAGLLYVGSFKTQAASGISLMDPTLIVTMMLAAAIGLDLLLTFADIRQGSIRERFAGQGLGVLLFSLFFLLLAISYLYSSSPIGGWEKLTKFAVFETLGFFAPFLLFKSEKDLRLFLWAAFLVAVPLSIRVITGMLHPTTQQWLGEADLTMIGEGHHIGIALFILIFYRFPGTWARVLSLVAMPVLAIGLVAAEARSTALSFLIVLLLCVTVFRVQSIVPRKTLLAGLLLVAITAGLGFLWLSAMPSYALRGTNKKAELQALLHGTLDAGGTTSIRIGFYKSAIEAFSKKPLQGWGLNGWSMYYYGEDLVHYPHNFVLEVAAEQGIPGVIVLLSLLTGSFGALRKANQAGYREFALMIPILMFSVLYNSVTGFIESRALFFWLGTSFVVARMARQQQLRQGLASADSRNHVRAYFTASYPENSSRIFREG